MNGYSVPPLGPYLSTLPLVDRDGEIMDLGSGNGMLLKFLSLFSHHTLTPFGIDLNADAIEQAKTVVLPDYADNFQVRDVINFIYDSPQRTYDLLVGNPFYAKPHLRDFTESCLQHLNPKGRLIYRIHDDVLARNRVDRLEDIPAFADLGMRISQGYGVSFCVFDR